MRIQTQQKITIGLSLGLALLVGVTLLASMHRVRALVQENLANGRVVETLANMRFLGVQYITYGDDRIRMQWLTQNTLLQQLLQKDCYEPEIQTIRDFIRLDHEAALRAFLQIVDVRARFAANQGKLPELAMLQDRLYGTLVAKSQDMTSAAFHLNRIGYERITSAERTASLLTMIFVILMISIIAANAHLIARGMLHPLRKIQDGAERIGAGDREHRIGIAVKNEIGELGHAFDDMALHLQQTHAALETARREQTNLTQAFFDNMHIGFSIVDTNLNIVRVNPAARHFMGLAPDDPLPAKWTDIKGRYDYPERVMPGKAEDLRLARVLRGGPMTSSELFMANDRHPQGLCLESVIKTIEGAAGLGAALVIWYDITERKQAEETLKRLAAIVASSDDAIIGKSLKGVISDWNPGAERMFGYSSAEAVGRPVSILIPPEREAEEAAILARIALGETVRQFETVRVRKDGARIDVAVTISPIKSSSGQIIGASKIARNITERKRAAEEIKKLNQGLELRAAQLEAANNELEAFCYSVSHDLRAPLRAIDGFSRMALDHCSANVDVDVQRYLQRVRANTQQMATLIDDLLAFSRLGRQQLVTQSVNNTELVRQCLDTLRGSGNEGSTMGNAAVTVGELPACSGDPGLLRQVWMNLLSNALKFSGKTAAPQVEIGSRVSGQVNEEDEAARGSPVYFVRDNGAGFDMRYSDKLFGVFQRLHSVQEFPGTGVGLALTQRIVHRHGGRVWAEAQPGQGATFYFTLGAHDVQD